MPAILLVGTATQGAGPVLIERLALVDGHVHPHGALAQHEHDVENDRVDLDGEGVLVGVVRHALELDAVLGELVVDAVSLGRCRGR